MTKEVPTITVDLNVKCKRCGHKGACDNGYCLKCVGDLIVKMPRHRPRADEKGGEA